MLCSVSELELGEDHSGILILPADLVPGTPIIEALSLTEDVVYEFDALPNRPDTLSVLGVARDLAAHQGVPLTLPEWSFETAGAPASDLLSVRIDDTTLCGRFELRALAGVEVGPSPRWLAQRLIASGMRPINNIVDVSNYVMLELGQPNHTYDLDKLPQGALGVRRARAGESITTLDGEERTLEASDGVIVDGSDRAIAIAGVMGGASTEISATTTNVALELAWWNPDDITATSARLNLHSEASLRFKRGVDWQIAPIAADRICQLLAEVAGTTANPGAVVADGDLPAAASITVRPDRVNGLLGTDLSTDTIVALLDPIGFASTPDGEALQVQVPTWRPDSTIEVDVVEEVARHFGFANIERTVPVSPHTGELSPLQQERRSLRRALIGAGLSEAMPMPFLAPGDLERCGLAPDGLVLSNPLAAEESVLRTSLLPGLLAAVAHNGRHRNPGARLFEIGRVFGLGDGDRPVITDVAESQTAGRVLAGESEHLAVVLAGAEAPAAVRLLETVLRTLNRWPSDDSSVLVAAEVPGLHPGRSATVHLGGDEAAVGAVGEIDPDVLSALGIDERVAWLQLDLATLLAEPAPVPLAQPVSRFPSSDIDLAFVVADDVPAAGLRNTIAGAADAAAGEGTQPVRVELFDVFRSDQLGAGVKSLAFRLRFQATDRTLTDDDVAQLRSAAIDAVASAHGGSLRG